MLILSGIACNTFAHDVEVTSFYNHRVLSNPAYTGSTDRSMLTMSYREYFPGYGLGAGSLYCSWDSFFENLHGGAGIYISENRLGNILNDLRTGATYSYHLRAGKELFINAGFMASVVHRSLNASRVILPDQIDPLLGAVLPSGEIIDRPSRTVFDAGVGFLIIFRNYYGGFSVNHLATPDITGNGGEGARLARRFSVHAAASYNIADNQLSVDPVMSLSLQGSVLSASGGTVISFKSLSINAIAYFDSRQGVSALQSGIFVEKGLLGVGYNHYFSTARGGLAIPSTLSSQLTLSISLYNVEKRELIRAIKYPKL